MCCMSWELFIQVFWCNSGEILILGQRESGHAHGYHQFLQDETISPFGLRTRSHPGLRALLPLRSAFFRINISAGGDISHFVRYMSIWQFQFILCPISFWEGIRAFPIRGNAAWSVTFAEGPTSPLMPSLGFSPVFHPNQWAYRLNSVLCLRTDVTFSMVDMKIRYCISLFHTLKSMTWILYCIILLKVL